MFNKKLLLTSGSFVKDTIVQKNGFTLIELLVVISIIVLLIAILLPALGRARDSAQSVVCMSNQRGFAQATASHCTDNKNFIPGPNTTGLHLDRGEAYRASADSPVQDWDYISPVLGRERGFSSNRLEKFAQILEEEFRCPTNEERYKERFRGPALPLDRSGQPLILSYMTPAMFHLVPQNRRSEYRNTAEHDGTFGGGWRLPAGYDPKIDEIGVTSEKVMAFEGARYWYAPNRGFDYSTVTNSSGLTSSPQGMFPSHGIAFRGSGEPYDPNKQGQAGSRRPNDVLERAAFRHFQKSTHTYFDGHVEQLTMTEAMDPRQYVPDGTRVGNAGQAIDAGFYGISNGMVIE